MPKQNAGQKNKEVSWTNAKLLHSIEDKLTVHRFPRQLNTASFSLAERSDEGLFVESLFDISLMKQNQL